MSLYLSLAVCLLGLLLYFFANPPKVQEVGRSMFWVGLLAYLRENVKVFHAGSG